MLTLEDVIKRAEAAAIENEKEAKRNREHGGWYYDNEAHACAICAAEHRQLAEWLRELQERQIQPEIIRCGECKYYKIDHPKANGYHCCYRCHNIFPMKETDFCSKAERRSDEQPD